MPGIQGVHIIDHASDQLGYYWDQRPGVYPAAQIAQSDFARFNVGPQLAQDNVDAVRQAGEALGLNPSAQQAYAQVTNPNAFSQPTIQFYPDQVETAEPDGELLRHRQAAAGARRTARPRSARRATTQGDGAISWNFGDGTTATQPIVGALHAHVPPTGPLPGEGEHHRQSRSQLQLDPVGADRSAADRGRRPASRSEGTRIALTAHAIGGHFDVLAAHWTFADGTTADGTTDHRSRTSTWTGSVTITDGAGNTATTAVHIS